MAVKWSGIIGSGYNQSKLGASVSKTIKNEKVIVKVSYYYWTRYAVDDESNNFYYDWDSYANTSLGSVTIKTTNNEWSDSNKKLIGTFTKTFDRGTTDKTKYFSMRFSGIEYGGGSGKYYVSFTIPAKEEYEISYNLQGGSGTINKQYKYYGDTINVTNIIPTKKGYNFIEWNTQKDGSGNSYLPKFEYSENKDNVLYAIWEKKVFEITLDASANGGSVNDEDAIVVYVEYMESIGSLPIAVKRNYKFIGWNTLQNGSGVFVSSTTKVSNNRTLYAIFELQANCYVRQNEEYKASMMYVKQNEQYKNGIVYVKHNGIYKEVSM